MSNSARFPLPAGDAPLPRVESRRPPPPPERDGAPRLSLHAILFALTTASVLYTGFQQAGDMPLPAALRYGASFAVPLLAILVVHELGHYVAAKLHGVPASLPYFLPLPFISLFGTAGAVIAMRDRIDSRRALLDIGAAGPLAGMIVAVPVLCYGLSLSEVLPLNSPHYQQEGQSLLYWALKRAVLGPIPPGYDVMLHPTALAGWGGLFLTMINLLPWGQLDGGHIAFALFGARQNVLARWLRRGLLILFAYNLAYFVLPIVRGHSEMSIGVAIGNSSFWLVWYGITGLIGRLSGGPDHPPFEPAPLDTARRGIAVACLVLFVLLFMPTPLAIY